MPNSIDDVFPPEIQKIFDRLFQFLDSDDEQNNALPDVIRSEIVNGVDCDIIPGAKGEFGRNSSNPIPTNGPIGELLYLSRLRTIKGDPVMFHRLQSIQGPHGLVDVYEVLSLDASVREKLFLSMYHPHKSKHVPRGYTFARKLDGDNLIYGVNYPVREFPLKLDAHIRKWENDNLGLPLPVGKVRKAINGSEFIPSVLDEADLG